MLDTTVHKDKHCVVLLSCVRVCGVLTWELGECRVSVISVMESEVTSSH